LLNENEFTINLKTIIRDTATLDNINKGKGSCPDASSSNVSARI
jgi:hypothetical protein